MFHSKCLGGWLFCSVFTSSICFVHASDFDRAIAPLIQSACISCHGDDTDTGLNLKTLKKSLHDANDMRRWVRVFDRVSSGEMPPASEARPDPVKLKQALTGLKKNLTEASLAKQARVGRVPARRLTKLELGYTLGDLLLIDGDLVESVPDEVESGSFDTVGTNQRISAVHMESYLKAADAALQRARRLGKNPYRKHRFDFLNSAFLNAFHEKPLNLGGSITLKRKDGVVLFADVDYLFRSDAHGFRIRAPGKYRIKTAVAAYQSKKPITVKLIRRSPSGAADLIAAYDLQPGQPRTVETVVYLQTQDAFYTTLHTGRPMGQDFGALFVAGGAKRYQGPGVRIEAQEVEGPLTESWPSVAAKQLVKGTKLVDTSGKGLGPFRIEGESDAIKTQISTFAERAIRRPLKDDELELFVRLSEDAVKRDQHWPSRIALRGVLTSPQFLMLDGEPGPLGNFDLASRLSYFLWKSLPDEELMKVAAVGKLTDSKVLASQVDRMLKDARSRRFVDDFLGQWLLLNKLDATSPDEKLYPEYDELLGHSMLIEPQLFFNELIEKNLSLTNLIDSDFTYVNRRLAEHYGIDGVTGQSFRRVDLPKDSPRGGILTQAAVLKTTANGTVTSPVTRGNFVLTSVLLN